MIITHYLCDRCKTEVKPKKGEFTLFAIDFFTGEMEGPNHKTIRAEVCRSCFDAIFADATKGRVKV